MKAPILTLAAAFGVLMMAQMAPQAAGADSKVLQNADTAAIQVSAQQRRYRRAQARHYRTSPPRYAHGAYGYPVNDPSIGYFPTLRRLQAEGRCVTDEGYGRFSFCNW
jgi:hypothetical protein